jgi:hypothetical protein
VYLLSRRRSLWQGRRLASLSVSDWMAGISRQRKGHVSPGYPGGLVDRCLWSGPLNPLLSAGQSLPQSAMVSCPRQDKLRDHAIALNPGRFTGKIARKARKERNTKIKKERGLAKVPARPCSYFPLKGGTSLIRTSPPPPQDHHRTLGIVLLKGPRRGLFLVSEVPLYKNLQPLMLHPQQKLANASDVLLSCFLSVRCARPALPHPNYCTSSLT